MKTTPWNRRGLEQLRPEAKYRGKHPHTSLLIDFFNTDYEIQTS